MPAMLDDEKTLRAFYERDYLTLHPDLDVADVLFKFEALRGLLAQALEETPDGIGQVVEIGCGSGTLLRMTSNYLQVPGIGVDLSASILSQAKRMSPGMSFVQADAGRLPLAIHRCDLIMFADLVEHVPHPREFLASLRGAKNIVMLVPLETGWIADAIHHYRRLIGKPTTRETCGHLHRWNLKSALRLLRSADLEVISWRLHKGKWTEYTTWRGRLYGRLSQAAHRLCPRVHRLLFGGYALLALCRGASVRL